MSFLKCKFLFLFCPCRLLTFGGCILLLSLSRYSKLWFSAEVLDMETGGNVF